jgi:hypothetical protein
VFPFFIHNVAEGVEYQMRRLNRHPSMAPRLQQHAVIVLAHGNWVDRNELEALTIVLPRTTTWFSAKFLTTQTFQQVNLPWNLVPCE